MKRDLGFMALGALLALVLTAAQGIKTDGDVETDSQLVSNLGPGKPPLVVASDTRVKGLNADEVDGLDSTAFAMAADTYTKAEVDALLSAAAAQRAFYLTASTHMGGPAAADPMGPLGACDAGFHFASLWELVDVSNLRYDVARPNALVLGDSGQGPPTLDDANPGGLGWVRTGSAGTSAELVPGEATCAVWTDPVNGVGTLAYLLDDWQADVPGLGIFRSSGWGVGETPCFDIAHVWCVEDG